MITKPALSGLVETRNLRLADYLHAITPGIEISNQCKSVNHINYFRSCVTFSACRPFIFVVLQKPNTIENKIY
jgi:hypothetical protein